VVEIVISFVVLNLLLFVIDAIDGKLEVPLLFIVPTVAIVQWIINENKLPAFYDTAATVNNANSIRNAELSDVHNDRKEEEAPFDTQRDTLQTVPAVVNKRVGMDMG